MFKPKNLFGFTKSNRLNLVAVLAEIAKYEKDLDNKIKVLKLWPAL